MADGGKNVKRYKKLNSRIPVLSKEYKKSLQDLKLKKEFLEKETATVNVLKQKLTEIQSHRNSARQLPHTSESCASNGSPYSKSEIRTTIITPKGTKRKVRPSLVRFQGKLEDVLEVNLEPRPGEAVSVNALLERLSRYDWLKAMERSQLLKEISKKLKTTITYKGRERKAYYNGFALINNKDDIDARKVSKVHDVSEKPSCKTKLSFQGPPEFPSRMDVELQERGLSVCKDLEIQERGRNQAQDFSEASMKQLQCHLEDLTIDNKGLAEQLNEVQNSFDEYVRISSDIMNKQDSIIELYKDILSSGASGHLSISEKNAIKQEIKEAKKIFDLGLRGPEVKDLLGVLHPSLFEELLRKLKIKCPTIISVLEQLVLSSNASRNVIKTPQMKMKAAIHLLASLMDVRDQHAHNDISLLFGLLCLCFGAGPSMINLLQRLGLSESYPVLLKVLKLQIQHYKEIICERAVEGWPVVTFQDNMQLMRTSMRHLRLSKLQKEKAKQNKMWDFTVRGWRVGDITGLEELFKAKTTAVQPQRIVKDLKSDDLLIENNPVHHDLWKDFKKRNTLRKMDIAFNAVQLNAEQLKTMNSEQLRQVASGEKKEDKKFTIKIPEIPCEFPDMAEKPAQIYPLPISHENQCTTLGVASNLDLFQEEFGFDSKKEGKYLPLKSSRKEFDIDLAYKRFAFLKMLDKHKKNQQNYEQFLRGMEQTSVVNTEHLDTESDSVDEGEIGDDDEVLIVVNHDSDSDPLSD